MKYRFRRLVEREDADPPLIITVEITYQATKELVDYSDMDEEEALTGGVVAVDWVVVGVHGPKGRYGQPAAFAVASHILQDDPVFDQQVKDWAAEDFAHREN